MKKYIATITTALAALTVSLGYASDQVTVNFTAQVTASTCSISSGSGKTVKEDMGELYLYNASDASAGKKVNLADIGMSKPLTEIKEIIKCSGGTTPTVNYAADSTANVDPTYHDVLMLVNASSSTTTPLGIRLDDKNASPQPAYLDFTKTTSLPGAITTKAAGTDQYEIDLMPELTYTSKATDANKLTGLWSSATTLSAKAVLNLNYS
ncbi:MULTISPECIES: fimbrial protein [Cysteiniphilum]|uniref:fimbrial protein n=1 Tax=Cysteiniphilum TaxID=2056696 RepID=UPI0017816482|nr:MULTISPECIES: type 1 fimbrial protein [Cysteiniphilum]